MKQTPDELELVRMMDDQAVRYDSLGRLHKRNVLLQQLLSKVQVLSDEDFDSAITMFASMVSSMEERRKSKEDNKDKLNSKSRDLLGEVNRKVTQNRGTTI